MKAGQSQVAGDLDERLSARYAGGFRRTVPGCAGRSTGWRDAGPHPQHRAGPARASVRSAQCRQRFRLSHPALFTQLGCSQQTACHHSDGSCSDQSGLGVCSVWGDEATATTAPASSISKALLLVVDVSITEKITFRTHLY